MLRKELEELFTPEEIDILVKKVSDPRKIGSFENVEELEIWCRFIRYHHNKFTPEYVCKELFESMMELTTNPARIYELWEDMVN